VLAEGARRDQRGDSVGPASPRQRETSQRLREVAARGGDVAAGQQDRRPVAVVEAERLAPPELGHAGEAAAREQLDHGPHHPLVEADPHRAAELARVEAEADQRLALEPGAATALAEAQQQIELEGVVTGAVVVDEARGAQRPRAEHGSRDRAHAAAQERRQQVNGAARMVVAAVLGAVTRRPIVGAPAVGAEDPGIRSMVITSGVLVR
jgi:hypothetical protein